MKTTIKAKSRLIVEFKPEDYFLVNGVNYPHVKDMDGKPHKQWTLNFRIDMSYKGKPDQIGMPVLFIDDDLAEELREVFTCIFENYDEEFDFETRSTVKES